MALYAQLFIQNQTPPLLWLPTRLPYIGYINRRNVQLYLFFTGDIVRSTYSV